MSGRSIRVGSSDLERWDVRGHFFQCISVRTLVLFDIEDRIRQGKVTGCVCRGSSMHTSKGVIPASPIV